MDSCTLLMLITGGTMLGIPACFGLGYLLKKVTVKAYNRLKDVEFPKVNITLPRIQIPQVAYSLVFIGLLVFSFVKFIPWGHTTPCKQTEQAKQAVIQKIKDCGCDQSNKIVQTWTYVWGGYTSYNSYK